MVAFVVGGEPKNPEKKLLKQGENNQQTQRMTPPSLNRTRATTFT